MTDPWFKFFPSDWLAGTRGLTAAETGIYITLVSMMYERREPLAMDMARLARLCGCPTGSFKRALEGLFEAGKLIKIDGGIWNERVEKQIQDRKVASRNGSDGAQKRWLIQAKKNKQKQRPENKSASKNECQNDAMPEARSQNNYEPNGSLSPGDDFGAEPIDEISDAVSAYNLAARESGWPQVQTLNQSRRSALRARLRECDGLEGWRHALTRAQDSPHCCGQNERGWTANFDFLTRQSSFAKLMEGNYDRRDRKTLPADDPALRSIARSASAF